VGAQELGRFRQTLLETSKETHGAAEERVINDKR